MTKARVLKWGAGFVTAFICVMVYLLLTGERGLSLRSDSARELDFTRLSQAESEKLGWSSERLDAAFAYTATLSSDTLIIMTEDQIVGAFGDLKKPYPTHSMRKAFLSTLVGQHIGPETGQIRLDATLKDLDIDDAPKPLTELQKQATVEHLLRSRSGINHHAAAEGALTAEKDRLLGDGENSPGTIWAYNNWDYNALTTIFEERTGVKVADAFQAGIAHPTMMEDFDLPAVTYIDAPELSRHKAAAFRMSARDLVKFGQLYLDRGEVNRKQIIPASWIDRITSDFTETGRNDLRWGHGYLWWIPSPDSGLPKGSFWAWGLGNQAVFVIPAWDTVIIHQSDTTQFLERFIPMISSGQQAEAAIEELILSCIERANRNSEYCIEHRFISRREFEKLISLVAEARL